MKRIAVICEDDRTWGLPAWERALPLVIREGYEIKGFFTCPEKLSSFQSHQIPRYYLRTFGIMNLVKMGVFTLIAALTRLISFRRSFSFSNLLERHGIPLLTCEHPNKPKVAKWIKKHEVDILFVMTGSILKKRLLSMPREGIINKHAGLLPANRGLYPGFWARLKNQDQGITFHEVIKEIDSGAVLVQEKVPPEKAESMVAFYAHTVHRFPEMLLKALAAMTGGERVVVEHDHPASYQSLPCRRDYLEYRKKGGAVIQWRDLVLAFKL